MRNKARAAITILLVLLVLVTAAFAVMRAGGFGEKEEEGQLYPSLDALAWESPFLYVPGSQLTVYPVHYSTELEVGQSTSFVVAYNGELLTPRQVTYEIDGGQDCASASVDGTVRGLGEGRVVVKVFLDADLGVYGYCTLNVVQKTEGDSFTATREDVSAAPLGDAAFEAMIAEFPESYKPYLRALHQKYPTWQFVPVHTGVDFYEAVYYESAFDKNKILNWNSADLLKRKYNSDYSFANGTYDLAVTGWVYASPAFVAYYMDPRNFMDERAVMQFESLYYDPDIHTVEGVESILRGSFMAQKDTSYLDTSGNLVQSDKTHAQVIFEAGVHYNVNPYYLAAKIRQEIGSTPSNSVTGNYPGYEGYYNYFNVSAYDGLDEIDNGLRYAAGSGSYGRPWNTPEKSIWGGAAFLAEPYISMGQDTGYMQKFNVDTANTYDLYTNQYMTNASGAVQQAISAYNGYAGIDQLQMPILFKIPVFDNMPAQTLPTAGISLGGSTSGIVTHSTTLRSGPAPFYPAVEDVRVPAGATVTILRCVQTDALDYRYRMYYPCWYEVRYTCGGQSYTGYISEEFAVRGSSQVLSPGESVQLSATLETAGSDDVVRYLSENANIATVSENGTVTAVGSGVVTIVGYTSCGAVDTYRITVR